MMEYTSNIMGFNWEREGGTKDAKWARYLEVRERKKRNGIRNVLEIYRAGTGTQIVHWGTLVKEIQLILSGYRVNH
jgi:hypothetical protein